MDNTAYRGAQDGSAWGAASPQSVTRRGLCVGRKRLTLGYNIHICMKKLQKTFGISVANSRPWKLGMLETGCCKK